MNPRRYSLIAAVIFAVMAALQLARAVLGWPVAVTTPWGMWAGYAGTYFWVDPKQQLVAVLMTQAPSPIRAYYRKLLKQLVYASIVNGTTPSH